MTAVWASPVRYAECDQQGIVFNAHYLVWADEGCTAWLAADYADLLAQGLDMRVKSTALTWSAPVRWGESVQVHVDGVEVGRTSFTVPMTVVVGGAVRCSVRTTYVVVDHDGTPTPVPDELRTRWTA